MVFVLDKQKKPIMPCTEKRARKLLEKGRAVIHRMVPFTIRLKDRTIKGCQIQEQTLKIDDGSKVTGLAITAEQKRIVFLGELHHKQGISEKLTSRRSLRRSRRNRKTRYRRCKYSNKMGQKNSFVSARPKGWLAPSLKARVIQLENTIHKLQRLTPIHSVWVESVRFDTQKMQNAEISGVEYQQGTLMGYTVREYLLEKFGRKCAYCEKKEVPLQVEHVHPKSKGGTNRVSNLAIACEDCNQEKDNLLLDEWTEELKKKNSERNKQILANLPKIQKQIKESLKDTARVNSTRKHIVKMVKERYDNVQLSTGAVTKFNRIQVELPKTHYYDAVCIYELPLIDFRTSYVLELHAKGRGSRQAQNTDKFGFPKGNPKSREKYSFGFQTGDLVKAVVTKGKKIGSYFGRVQVRSTGWFNIKVFCLDERVQGISYKDCQLVQRNDGYEYHKKKREKIA